MSDRSWIDILVLALGYRFGPNPKPVVVQTDVSELEKALRGKLPEDYLYFVERYGGAILGGGGCQVQAPIVERCTWGDTTAPDFFYQLVSSARKNPFRIWQSYRGRIPPGVFSINSDGMGNEICLDVAGDFPGSVWFWDHEQRWFADYFSGTLEEAAQEIDHEGIDASRFSVHDIIRGWARLHPSEFDRPPDYMGMYRMADSFADFLRSLRRVRYDLD
jgi:SMI1 / KNR4 family (SUKH-1)